MNNIGPFEGGYTISINQPPRWLDPRLYGAIRQIIKRRAAIARCLDCQYGFAVTTVAAGRRAQGVGVWVGAPISRRDQLTLVAAGVSKATAKEVRWQSRWG
ncbi:hypothetical protein A2V80_01800 [Candidatus Woesebacteria bacterium RBG_16_39_8b]|uniref:Uncharacterized protein n=1 Tax=Candidatus Woesebacteria bacterium RBG_16_39_8b TaxID=1802482 RepID=A0A1F7XAN8_9BACT|nr:MAG: hypothetical protein A2V80_01800 [Candidatus Woesebacteria bacterium RBG_16_39_8b]